MYHRVLGLVLVVVVAAVAGASVPAGVSAVAWAARIDSGQQTIAAQTQPPAQPLDQPGAGTGGITGQVVAADNGTPVRRARVVLVGMFRPLPPRPAPGGTPANPVVTAVVGAVSLQVGGSTITSGPGQSTRIQREAESDVNGRFEFKELPAGTYSVSVMPAAGFVSPRSSDPVIVAEGKTATATLRLERAGAITGRVLDDDGEPLARSQVQAATWESVGGARRMTQMQSASTNDLGEFRIFGLRPGDYYVSASPAYRYAGGAVGPRTGFVQTYFPGVPSIAGATRVTVHAGTDTGGIDIRMLTAPVATITGTITGPDGQPLPPTVRPSITLVSKADGHNVPTSNNTRPDGTFVLADVGPGDYYLTATAYPATPSGVTPVEGRPGVFAALSVDGTDLTVKLELNEGATVSGHVRLEEPGSAPPDQLAAALPATIRWPPGGVTATRISISQDLAFPLAAVGSFGIRPPVVGEDGAFTVSGLRGWLRFNAIGSGVLKAILLNGHDITATTMEIAGTERLEGLELVLTREVGLLQGRVTDCAGDPVQAIVIAFPDDDSRWFPGSPFVRSTQSASPTTAVQVQPGMPTGRPMSIPPGSFTIGPGLLPGRYHVVAVERSLGSGMPTDRATLKALAPSATAVTIEAGRTAVVDLRVMPDPTKGRVPVP